MLGLFFLLCVASLAACGSTSCHWHLSCNACTFMKSPHARGQVRLLPPQTSIAHVMKFTGCCLDGQTSSMATFCWTIDVNTRKLRLRGISGIAVLLNRNACCGLVLRLCKCSLGEGGSDRGRETGEKKDACNCPSSMGSSMGGQGMGVGCQRALGIQHRPTSMRQSAVIRHLLKPVGN